MSSFFGGSPQGMTPPVAKKMYDLPGRGRNDFLYINRELHPNAPSAPGEHGVWQPNIVCWYRDPKDDPFMAPFMEKKIPVKDEPGIEVVPKVEDVERKPNTTKGKQKKKPTPKLTKKAPENTTGIYTTLVGGFDGQQGRKWLYIGQCRPVDEDTLRLDDWLLWDNKVRLAWADNLVKGEWGVWVRFRARYRRKYGREPTKTEMHHWWALVQAKVEDLDDWKADRLLIKEDMDLGKECLTIGVVKCVGYDAAFQRQIARGIESYVPRPKKPKKSRKGKKDEDVEMLEESDVDMDQPGPSTSKIRRR
ncbi:hypothetical protein PENSPDRAFT_227985 [Peniophora sp. CONT]|nr:hypothetical protein PENSPDRAFT_227985 [Peniophora sp. CONT]